LVGGDSGATLGAIWLNSEWHRYKLQAGPFGVQQSNDPEGKDVVAAIWLSLQGELGKGRALSLREILDIPARQRATPMVFMYGDGDAKSKKVANDLEKIIKGSSKDQKYKFTGAVPLKGNAKLTGAQLLEQRSIGADQAIAKYVESVVGDR